MLDPVFALRTTLTIQPGRSAAVTFTTFMADDREHAMQLADLYHDPYSTRRALDLSWAHAQAELRELGITPADAALYQELAGHLLYEHPEFKDDPSLSSQNTLGQPELWGMGISGDWPILLATLSTVDGLPSVRQLLKVHHYWRTKGLISDLVILNEHPPTYLQELNDELLTTVMASSEAGLLDRPGGVFIRRADLLKPEDITLLNSLARIKVDCDGLGLGNFLERAVEGPFVLPQVAEVRESEPGSVELVTTPVETASSAPELAFFNGIGGFNEDREYEIRLVDGNLPPAPWVNVIGNAAAGFITSEAGSGATWAENSYFFRLTPWSNDPVSDPTGECIYLRDEETREIWTPTPEPVRHTTPYTVKHGSGYSVFEHEHRQIATVLRVGLPENDPVKVQVLSITNKGASPRRLTITGYVEWVLGVNREQTRSHVRTEMVNDGKVMLARNYYDPMFAGRVAFSSTSEAVTASTADRGEFIGRNGDLEDPAALRRGGMSGSVGDTIDPCAAMQSIWSSRLARRRRSSSCSVPGTAKAPRWISVAGIRIPPLPVQR